MRLVASRSSPGVHVSFPTRSRQRSIFPVQGAQAALTTNRARLMAAELWVRSETSHFVCSHPWGSRDLRVQRGRGKCSPWSWVHCCPPPSLMHVQVPVRNPIVHDRPRPSSMMEYSVMSGPDSALWQTLDPQTLHAHGGTLASISAQLRARPLGLTLLVLLFSSIVSKVFIVYLSTLIHAACCCPNLGSFQAWHLSRWHHQTRAQTRVS